MDNIGANFQGNLPINSVGSVGETPKNASTENQVDLVSHADAQLPAKPAATEERSSSGAQQTPDLGKELLGANSPPVTSEMKVHLEVGVVQASGSALPSVERPSLSPLASPEVQPAAVKGPSVRTRGEGDLSRPAAKPSSLRTAAVRDARIPAPGPADGERPSLRTPGSSEVPQ